MAGSLWKNEKIGWSYSSATGVSGGCIILWKEGLFEVIASFKGGGFLEVKIL